MQVRAAMTPYNIDNTCMHIWSHNMGGESLTKRLKSAGSSISVVMSASTMEMPEENMSTTT